MRTVYENTKSKTPQTSFFYVTGRALTSPKGNLFLKQLNLLIFNT